MAVAATTDIKAEAPRRARPQASLGEALVRPRGSQQVSSTPALHYSLDDGITDAIAVVYRALEGPVAVTRLPGVLWASEVRVLVGSSVQDHCMGNNEPRVRLIRKEAMSSDAFLVA